METGIWSWPNKTSAPELLDIHNEIRDRVDEAQQELAEELDQVVASTAVTLTINEPIWEICAQTRPEISPVRILLL